MNVMQKSVWRVTGYHIDDGDENIFEAYFSDRDTAHAVYAKGEREYGLAAGYTSMNWALEGFYLDNDPHIDQMFEDVKGAMEEDA
jgi:hypothetical protein